MSPDGNGVLAPGSWPGQGSPRPVEPGAERDCVNVPLLPHGHPLYGTWCPWQPPSVSQPEQKACGVSTAQSHQGTS